VGLQWRPQGIDPMLLLAAFTAVGLMPLLPAYLWETTTIRSVDVSIQSLTGMLYTGVFPGFLGYVFYNAAVAAVGPNRSSQFIHLMPVFTTILAAIFLGERPFWYHIVGIVLVFAGIFLATRRPAG
jgi:drug/metabolite transporter (DMT)-like permease